MARDLLLESKSIAVYPANSGGTLRIVFRRYVSSRRLLFRLDSKTVMLHGLTVKKLKEVCATGCRLRVQQGRVAQSVRARS